MGASDDTSGAPVSNTSCRARCDADVGETESSTTSPPKSSEGPSFFLSFSSGVRLATYATVARELSIVGLPPDALDGLLKALGIRSIYIDNVRFFDFFGFLLRLKAALCADGPDIHISSAAPSSTLPRLDADTLPSVLQELLACRELVHLKPAQHFRMAREALLDAAARFASPPTKGGRRPRPTDTPTSPIRRKQP